MQVHPTGPPPAGATPLQGVQRGGRGNEAPVSAHSVGPSSGGPGKAAGVVRLIQEGHFQGVADVRLRINFADELQIIQSQAVREAVEIGAEPFLAGLNDAVDAFLAQPDLDPALANQIDEARLAFTEEVEAAFAVASESADTGSLVESLEAAFQEFIQSLEALVPIDGLDPAATVGISEPAVSGVLETSEEGPEAIPGFGEFLQSLQDAFAAATDTLQSEVTTASALPPISEPNGNGAAYARFLDILQGLTGGVADQDASGVDTEA